MVTYYMISLLCLITSFFFYYHSDFRNLLQEIKIKQNQIEECKSWCNKEGILITFDETERMTCQEKCFKFSITPPIFNYICKTFCKKIDLIFSEKFCSKSEFCIYNSEVNALSVKEAVELRWFKALRNRIFGI